MSGYAQDGFERSRAVFEQVVAGLAAQDADERTHAQMEEHLSVQGRELMRQMYQDHLDLRAARERRQQQVVDAEQVAHTRVEWEVLIKLRCCPRRAIAIVQAILALHTVEAHRYLR